MEVLNVTAPISIDDLKKYFVSRDTFYLIDYKNSQLKGKKLLTYLSNLDIPSDIKIDDDGIDELQELFLEYLESHTLVNSEILERNALRILFCHKKIISDPKIEEFIEKNKEIVEHWSNIVDSLMLYNMFTLSVVDEFQQYVKSYEHDDTIRGINFVNLLKYPEFYFLFSEVENSNLKFYSRLFEDNIYKGKPLFEFWANESNEVFLMTWGIAEGIISPEEIAKVINDSNEQSST